MGRIRRTVKRRKQLEKRVARVKEKYANSPNLPNMVKRILRDPDYKEIKIRYNHRVVCFYCGQVATGVDHQPPISKIEEYESICASQNRTAHLLKVSCCGECNRLLGNSVFSTFKAKLENLRRRLKKKYSYVKPEDKIEYGRLRRRLIFERGIKRVTGRYE